MQFFPKYPCFISTKFHENIKRFSSYSLNMIVTDSQIVQSVTCLSADTSDYRYRGRDFDPSPVQCFRGY